MIRWHAPTEDDAVANWAVRCGYDELRCMSFYLQDTYLVSMECIYYMHIFIVAWTLVLNKLLGAMQHSLSRVEMRRISSFSFNFNFNPNTCFWIKGH